MMGGHKGEGEAGGEVGEDRGLQIAEMGAVEGLEIVEVSVVGEISTGGETVNCEATEGLVCQVKVSVVGEVEVVEGESMGSQDKMEKDSY